METLPAAAPTVALRALPPAHHAVSLTATDSTNNVASADASFNIAPLSIAQASAPPVLDGSCDDPVYAGGAAISLKPYPDGGQATARLLRSDDYLWACFSGLKKGAESPGSSVGLRVDVDNSRSAQVQTSDYAFTVGEDGDVVTLSGDGSGGFTNVGPGGLLGQISSGADWWSAELRIDKANFNGWDHLVGLKLGHYWLESVDDDYVWPYLAIDGQPNTWAATALGSQPLITALDPYTATVNSAAFTLAVEGSGFVSGTTVLWGGNALPTTVIDEAHLTVDVGAAQLTAAGIIQLKARTPGRLRVQRTCLCGRGEKARHQQPVTGERWRRQSGHHVGHPRQQLCARCPGAVERRAAGHPVCQRHASQGVDRRRSAQERADGGARCAQSIAQHTQLGCHSV